MGEETILISEGDLAEAAGADAEAYEVQLLGALMWAPEHLAATAAGLIGPADFYRPAAGELAAVIIERITDGRDYHPAAILAALTATGKTSGQHGTTLARLLTAATTSPADPLHLPALTYLVAAAAARRAYTAAAVTLDQAARTAPEARLFEQLLTIGHTARARENRMTRIRAWAGHTTG
ncbi:DnaB-like helicase N-terminal domain-containing protein [Hoyosella subflava]|uniref:Putative replicative DNA helicase n=1 Tax=Hoyosella subflava (strain DSM 45089 / JCM 17490 / NBRC 109087 / DQS3-9A1) TaxID=443218 RepID=F6ESL5_HOYSD|nr:DnaB-like helicase N-terminal domain-containing protein [Hoyosella subflava]AEF43136.1 putative replicative DNA helicase [Hoyosella subflava DQS3-9A1]